MSKVNIRAILRFLANTQPRSWILAGFLIVYISFFIYPIFFSSQTMQFPAYIPVMKIIGGDLDQILGYSKPWALFGDSPYVGENPYPPFVAVFFAPFLLLPFSSAYRIIVLLGLISFILGIYFLTAQFKDRSGFASVFFFVIFTGFFSYGLQFELERGQFNIIAMVFCFAAVWIYYFHNKFRYLAYILFAISVQLKLYPLIFIVMFVSDWKDWKTNIKKLLILSGIIFAWLFVLGPKIFIDFLMAIRRFTVSPSVMVNHSVRAFVHMLADASAEIGRMWVREYSPLIQLLFLVVIFSCIVMVVLQAYWKNPKIINTYLFLTCALGASLIPSVSHDYKLPILAAPTAAFLLELFSRSEKEKNDMSRLHLFVLIFIISIAYSATLFSYTNKPGPFWGSNFPPLFIMLLAVTYYSMLPVEDSAKAVD